MTDGILLDEMQRDRDLRRYDTIIIDEAHERSLNIDFILGYLKQLLPRRPDLKVIITSATIDPERFAEHFAPTSATAIRAAPIIEVSGRTYPVEVRYRPAVDPDGRHAARSATRSPGSCEAVEELWTEAPPSPEATDILVFLSGEREIRDAADALDGDEPARRPRSCRSSPGCPRPSSTGSSAARSGRRIVLATNVAETSLTVPGIRYVVDTGTARISRYSQRTKVQRLPIEPISQASANQRAGRCGRVAPTASASGSTPRTTTRPGPSSPSPRSSAPASPSVILQMTSLGLGDIAALPVRRPARLPPDRRRRAAARGAAGLRRSPSGETPPEGSAPRRRGRGAAHGIREVAGPAARSTRGSGGWSSRRTGSAAPREVLVIVAALSIQDPRERPADKQTQADQSHARFSDEHSDFVSPADTLWRYLKEQQKALSHSAFRRMCKSEYLHYLRIREWQDLHAQLRAACRSARIDPDVGDGGPATPSRTADTIHQALLAGLLSHVGAARRGQARLRSGRAGARFGDLARVDPVPQAARPGSCPPSWSRRPGSGPASTRASTRCGPSGSAPHLVKRTVQRAALVAASRARRVATERVTLYGVPLVAARTVQYAPDQPRGVARALHPARARRGRLGDPPRVLPREPGSAATGSPSSRSGPGAATSSSTTRRSSRSTTQRIPADVVSASGTSTAGGRRRAARRRSC